MKIKRSCVDFLFYSINDLKFLQFSKFSSYVKKWRKFKYYRKVVRLEVERNIFQYQLFDIKWKRNGFWHVITNTNIFSWLQLSWRHHPASLKRFLYVSRYRLSIQLRLYLAVELHPTLLTTIILPTKNILHLTWKKYYE